MTGTRRLTLLAPAAVVLATVWACSGEAPPTGVAPTSPHFALSVSEEQQLKEQQELEKQRIKLAQEASKPVYDSLKLEWERLNKSNPKGNPELVYCDPLQYAADVKIVGPEGADMSIGPHKLSIPPGALTRHTVITGEMPVSLSVGVKLSPHGTTFVNPPKLTLSYKHCTRPKDVPRGVVYVDANEQVLERPTSREDKLSGLVDGWLQHFSNYAVAYRGSAL